MTKWTAGTALLLAIACAVTACSAATPIATPKTPATPMVTVTTPTVTQAEQANPPPPGQVANGCHERERPESGEVRAVAEGAEVWALLFAEVPFKRGKEVKIVWRMTGSGPLRVTATLPDGTKAKRTFGPEEHGGSTWQRPGREWGTGFVFPKPGCWRITATRTEGTGHLELPVT